jgi:phosphatidylserine/phosphatidylglycerophosphate/cardiolipin synthase-like enzyme
MGKVYDLRRDEITFKEWDRTDWTFHAKGLWIDSKNSGKLATIIGSSNYGYSF